MKPQETAIKALELFSGHDDDLAGDAIAWVQSDPDRRRFAFAAGLVAGAMIASLFCWLFWIQPLPDLDQPPPAAIARQLGTLQANQIAIARQVAANRAALDRVFRNKPLTLRDTRGTTVTFGK